MRKKQEIGRDVPYLYENCSCTVKKKKPVNLHYSIRQRELLFKKQPVLHTLLLRMRGRVLLGLKAIDSSAVPIKEAGL